MRIFNKERRQYPRFGVNAKIRLSHASFGNIDAMSQDISDNGLFVVAGELPQLPKGAHINVQFLDSSNPELLFNTRVVRMYRQGVGLVVVDYEYRGQRFKLQTLKKQWLLASQDINRAMSRPGDDLYT